MSMKMGRAIGNKLGQFLEIDCDEAGACVGKFLRIKVRLDITKPLWRGYPIDLPTGEKALVEFRYENMTSLCFGCGRIGHKIMNCTFISKAEREAKDPPYGRFLFAKRDSLKIPGSKVSLDSGESEGEGEERRRVHVPAMKSTLVKESSRSIITHSHESTHFSKNPIDSRVSSTHINIEVGSKKGSDETAGSSIKKMHLLNDTGEAVIATKKTIKMVQEDKNVVHNSQDSSQEKSLKLPSAVGVNTSEEGPLKEQSLFGNFDVEVHQGSDNAIQNSVNVITTHDVGSKQGLVRTWKRKARAGKTDVASHQHGMVPPSVGEKRRSVELPSLEKIKCARLQENNAGVVAVSGSDFLADGNATAKVMGPDSLAHHEQ